MKIYFAGSITGGRGDVQIYQEIVNHLKKKGQVLTEHFADSSLGSGGEQDKGLSGKEIHDRDIDWLGESEAIVAEVTQTSLGVGYEIGRMVERNINLSEGSRKKILCLYRTQEGKRLSAMISGSGVALVEYSNVDEALSEIDKFFENLKESQF